MKTKRKVKKRLSCWLRACFTLLALFFSFKANAQEKKVPQDQDLFSRDRQVFIINGEFIYWTVAEGALDYAVKMTQPLTGTTLPQGNIKRAKFDWDPGYRISFGYFRAPNFWELIGEWTYIHINGKNSTSRPQNCDLFVNGTYPYFFDGAVSSANSEIFLHYKLANLIAKRVFLIRNNPHLRLRLGAGLTATWLHQSWKTRYFSASSDAVTIARNRWRYWGVGPRAQLSFDWFWGYDIYMTGHFSTALVVGRYRNRAKQEASTLVGNARLKDYRLSLNVQFFLGPSYQKSFNWGRIEIFAGYEWTIWNNLQEVYRSIPSDVAQAKQIWINRSLVAMHGLTTRLTLNF